MALRKEDFMSKHIPFDTLAFAKKLESRGVQVKEAEAYAEVLADVLEADFSNKQAIDTVIINLKDEVQVFRSDTVREFQAVRSEMASEFKAVRSEMTREFEAVRSEMTNEFKAVRSEVNILRADMNAKFAEVKSDVIKWVFGISFAQAALIISVIKFLH